jgi:hypothetical protein
MVGATDDNVSHLTVFDKTVLVPIIEQLEPVELILGWARLLAGYRFRMVRELSNLFVADNLRPSLYTPATVDYDFWIGENSLAMQDQLELARRIARLPGRDFLVNGFIAFDPLH